LSVINKYQVFIKKGKQILTFKTIIILLLLHCSAYSFAQKVTTDTFFLAKKKGLLGKLGKSFSFHPTPPSDTLGDALKNISPFIVHKGAVIRNLKIEKLVFGQSITDTSSIYKSHLTKFVNSLHFDTREITIRNNLFFKSGDSVKPYIIADNEAYLRTIPYLQDARILIKEVPDESWNYDSVDVVVLYKEVLPIGGVINSENNRNLYLQEQDDNLSGYGDRLKLMTLYDLDRVPQFGYGAEYLLRNIRGSFINLTAGFQNLAPAYNNGKREETRTYASLDLPLVSPHRRITGSMLYSYNFTTYQYLNDTTYYSDYKYNLKNFDTWIGFNITSKHNLYQHNDTKMKQFLSVRFIDKIYFDKPDKYKAIYNYQYASLKSLLFSYTAFKQELYHTSFIYGFGKTEDVPVGENGAFIGGWTNSENIKRPYLGIDLVKNYFTNNKNYFNLEFKTGTYINNGNFQDISILASIETFTRLRKLGNTRWLHRNFFTGSITQQINTTLNPPVYLNSRFGLPDFINPDSTGSTRVTGKYQSVFFNTWKFWGFSFAPFGFANACFMKPKNKNLDDGKLYASFGAGLRSRNENLIFGTMELKVSYYPVTTQNMSPWNISFNTDLRFSYNSVFVKQPDVVGVN